MLGNKNKYTLLRVFYVFLSPFYSLLSLFVRKNNNIIITGSLNQEYSDNAKALFEILINEDKFNDKVYFVINDKYKRHQFNKIYPGRFISNLSFKNAFFILKARYWFCSAMELPLAVFFQRHLRQVTHLGHGMLYKKIGLIETQVSWYKKIYYILVTSSFTYTIATTPFCQKVISAGFGMPLKRVILTPQPKTAQIAFPLKIEDKTLSNKESMHVLYAPTWRPYASVKLFPFDDFKLSILTNFLADENIHIWLRVHPRFEQDIDSELLANPNIHLFSAKEYSEINSYLSYFDALITDFSSIYYDYLTLERPVLFFDYDFTKYNEMVGVIDDYKKVKATETIVNYTQFQQQLLCIKNGGFDLERIKEVNKIVNYPVRNEFIEKVVLNKLNLF
ncbi:CDP-glycerol glycerophosphotransferase family protein [Morganella morganii]|uniref:CDP-glycerol glycerophosphotransferase family protein n=1 Tax=Morganella morganii TaxID=582 RepID=A0AAE4JQV8_MORMO|nr:CDP-glycerol glycerophosphotransferase family protein [Morganella morganii]MDS0900465.1 CDP-glycerol glycerophosphotransferase family protein [Morganella morganii]